jgi:hypothetical protein
MQQGQPPYNQFDQQQNQMPSNQMPPNQMSQGQMPQHPNMQMGKFNTYS